VLAMIAGERWHRRLDEARFRRVVAALMVLSGLALLFK
ncbi:MAG: sulfite exporter TauE/SafE family protein, partial [Betaproteobacteria bacterium]|nr:sulfite exporter TauE/SafE family protein [Betaproteobacteria bacterium]